MAEIPAEATAKSGAISRAHASLAALETLERMRQAPDTSPTPDDLARLRGWSGWGPLAPALDSSRSGTWAKIGERINFLLPPEHYNEGIQATYNAFYTPPEVTTACWQLLTDLGFTGGSVLEPGCGAGAFMSAAPNDVDVRWTGVERDPTTAAIAALLNPRATIRNQRFEEARLPSGSVDAVIGNIPFGDVQVYDPTAPLQARANLHNYFIWRSVQALKPGGVALLITSRFTLDAFGENAQSTRSTIAWDADLLGAIRMPNSALRSGGTEALADILVLRKRRPDEARDEKDKPNWIKTGFTVGNQPINEYFLANPHMVLGELAEDGAPRYGRTLRVDARPDDPPFRLALAEVRRQIVDHAAERGRTWRVIAGVSAVSAETAPFELRADGKKEGSFHLVDGAVHEVIDAKLVPVARAGKELPKLVALRDAVVDLLDAEADHARADADLEPLRAEANQRYDGYVAAHGYLNRYTVVEGKPDEDSVVQASRRRPTMGGFRRDPDYVTVLALEDFDDDTRTATKAALLTRRVNRPRERATHAESPTEAIALCRDELGRIDPERIAELLGADVAEAEGMLSEIAFRDPEANAWVPEDEYLTGNVREKLNLARSAAARDPELYRRNVPALEAAQPADLDPEQIHANLGAPWIPAADVQRFAEELLEFPVTVWSEPRTSTWSVSAYRRAEESAAATSEWGTSRLNAYRLLETGLNGKAPVVYDVIDEVRVRNQDETIAANDRLDAIAARFSTWVWEDPDRADRLAAAYNKSFNAIVPRKFDGGHLTFPGVDPEFAPYDHQRDMVARMITGADALCPYPVGTGKTATMFMAAAKLKQLGLAQKPLIIVVPSTLEQIARDGKRLLPNARILMAGKEDLRDARARKLFAARCAMEDWDAVVMSHPSFTSLPVHATAQAAYVANLAEDYRTALISAKAADGSDRKIKQIAKMVDRLEAEAKTLMNHATDDGVFFEHLGVDYLLVDELHYFKNLGVPVHTDGFAIQGSKRAQDLDMKIGWLRQQHPEHAVITGFTGTPVSNTLLEAFVIQHYLQPQRLEELGIASADAWAANFASFKTAVELSPDGSFRLNRRPASIVNLPELMHTIGEVSEMRPPESFAVQRPDALRHTVAVEASETVLDFVQTLAERADAIHSGGVSPQDDNMLAICSDGRKVALHESLVGLETEGPGKVGEVVDNVARIYHQTKGLELPGGLDPGIHGRLQLVFCDLGTPNKDKGNQVYGLIRQGLIRAGVPAEKIRFIHEATTDARRLVLFDQCNKGEVAVLLGSTDKLGVGVNIQRRAIALHHVDAPWRPDQVEQRDGRIVRPKNLNPAVEVYRYVTEGSFDAYMWQALERKEKALRPILSGHATSRSVEDIGDVALDYGQIKAISTGNPLLAEVSQVSAEVKRLASLAASHQRAQRRLRNDIQTFTMQAAHAAQNADALEAVSTVAASTADTSAWTDRHGNTIPMDDAATSLATLAESTMTRGFCDGAMRWRSMEIDFTRDRSNGTNELAARITTGGHRITVPLKAGWTAKGQHWRVLDAIAAAVRDAPQTAAATRENIADLQKRIVENRAALGTPFPEAEALEAARAQRAALDAAIREQATKDEEARRARKARAAANLSQPADPVGKRRELLARMHTAMTAVADRVRAEQDDEPQHVVEPIPASTQPTATASNLGHDIESRRISQLNTAAEPQPTEFPASKNHAPRANGAEAGKPAPQEHSDHASIELAANPELAKTPEPQATPHDRKSTDSAAAERVAPQGKPTSMEHNAPSTSTSSAEDPSSANDSRNKVAKPDGPVLEPSPTGSHQEPDSSARRRASAAPDVDEPLAPSGSGQRRPQPTPQPSSRPETDQQPTMYEYAVDLAMQGLAVFPLRPGTKKPLFKDWEERATTDIGQITTWWTDSPRANIGIACGPSNLLVIDLDADKQPGSTHHGQRTLLDLAAGRDIPQTYTVASARGGRHLYYRQPDSARLGNTVGRLGTLVDTRGHGGFIVGPGSKFERGTYRVEREAAIAQLPAWLNDVLAQRHTPPATEPAAYQPPGQVSDVRRTAYSTAALRRSAATVASAREGTRNDTLNRESFRIGRLVGGGVIDHGTAYSALYRASRKAGLPADECARTITSGLAAGIKRPRSIPDRTRALSTKPETKEPYMSTTEMPEATTFATKRETGRENTSHSPRSKQPGHVEHEQPTHVGSEEASEAIDIEAIFDDALARVRQAQQAIPDDLELDHRDELTRALDEVREALVNDTSASASLNEQETIGLDALAGAPEQLPSGPAEDLDERLAAVDSAYAEATARGIPTTSPEWAGIRSIHSAIHNLWDALKAAAGTYWVELAADSRTYGLLATLAGRASRTIANLATAAADRIQQPPAPPTPAAANHELGLREAFINARSRIHTHAVAPEWQRIAALWGTINTLSRQTGDPGIREVVARSADAISDFADSLAHKTTSYGSPGNAPAALEALARAAERHAASLRTVPAAPSPGSSAAHAPVVAAPAPGEQHLATGTEVDADAVQEAARRVAQRAQQRLNVSARPQGSNALHSPGRNRLHAHDAHAQRATTDQPTRGPGVTRLG